MLLVLSLQICLLYSTLLDHIRTYWTTYTHLLDHILTEALRLLVCLQMQVTPYTIGYMDAGAGSAASSLTEVSVQNKAGNFLTSEESDVPAAAKQVGRYEREVML